MVGRVPTQAFSVAYSTRAGATPSATSISAAVPGIRLRLAAAGSAHAVSYLYPIGAK
jgi:hypothetical protein